MYEGIRIKNIRVLELTGPALESKEITKEISDLIDDLMTARAEYDPGCWEKVRGAISDSAILKGLIQREIGEYRFKIDDRARKNGFIEAMQTAPGGSSL